MSYLSWHKIFQLNKHFNNFDNKKKKDVCLIYCSARRHCITLSCTVYETLRVLKCCWLKNFMNLNSDFLNYILEAIQHETIVLCWSLEPRRSLCILETNMFFNSLKWPWATVLLATQLSKEPLSFRRFYWQLVAKTLCSLLFTRIHEKHQPQQFDRHKMFLPETWKTLVWCAVCSWGD